MQKTVQALKIAASWTPNADTAGAMMTAALNETAAGRMHLSGGRLALKHAIKIDFSDPQNATLVSERVAEIKDALSGAGVLHDFRATAGAVHAAEAEILAAPEPSKAEAKDAKAKEGAAS